MTFRTGIIAIIGKPNTGKSTLLNALIGQKIAAVTTKPQTTRQLLRGIRHSHSSQMIFLDTPGYHPSDKPLNLWMIQQAKTACEDADLVILLTSVESVWTALDDELFQIIHSRGIPFFTVLNKIDLSAKPNLLPMIDKISMASQGSAVIPISADKNEGLEELIQAIEVRLPTGPALFPEDQPTDQTVRGLAAEIVREKISQLSRQEIPYAIAVQIETYQEPERPGDPTRISAVIHVERPSQKSIVIGKRGRLLKEVGTAARQEIEAMIGGKVFLSLFVKVSKDWTKDPRKRKELGYG